MLNPSTRADYVIRGTVYDTISPGRVETQITIGSGPGTTQDIYIVGSTNTAKSQTLTCYNLTQDSELTNSLIVKTSSTTGKYLISCNNFEAGWNENDIILIITTNVTETSSDKSEDDEVLRNQRSGSRRRNLVDEEGNEISSNNPLPVFIIDENFESVNVERSWNITNIDGQPEYEEVIYKGITYRRTFTYTTIDGMRTMTTRGAWIEQ